MLTVDGRCHCKTCEDRTGNIYRMIGTCRNCGQKDILLLFRAGDEATARDCPVCGCGRTVMPMRLASPDEIPAAVVTDGERRDALYWRRRAEEAEARIAAALV